MAHNRLKSFSKTLLNTLWPSYRGKRAGRLVRERERVSMKQIAVVSARKVSGCPWFSAPLHCHNPAYCIQITPASTDEKRNSPRTAYVPSLFVWNVMSLAPKVDELRHLLKYANLDLVCITESWLKSHIHDNVVALESYNIICRDRRETEHSGVCVYIKNTIKSAVVEDLEDPSFEVLWIQISPIRLPRGFSSILLRTFYHPPTAFLEYLERCLSSIETRYSNCGFCLVGDFNRLETTRFRNNCNLKQIVNFPTRGERTLTNLQDNYETPTQRPPLGLSDYMSLVK